MCSLFILRLRVEDFHFDLPSIGKSNKHVFQIPHLYILKEKKPSDRIINMPGQCSRVSAHSLPSTPYGRPHVGPSLPASLHLKGTGATYPMRTKAGAAGGNAEPLK